MQTQTHCPSNFKSSQFAKTLNTCSYAFALVMATATVFRPSRSSSRSPSSTTRGKRCLPTKRSHAYGRWFRHPSWPCWWGKKCKEGERDQPSWRNRLPSTCSWTDVLHRCPESSPVSLAAAWQLPRRLACRALERTPVGTRLTIRRDCRFEIQPPATDWPAPCPWLSFRTTVYPEIRTCRKCTLPWRGTLQCI